MAKSKNGGTRSYIRGRVGAEVYSLGKDGAGKKQQVVRSIAETVANPQTEAQMRGRMIMSTVMQAAKAMKSIIDHSFDGVPTGQPSISQFISRNYELIKADVAAHPASGNKFGVNTYQEKGAKQGQYVVSDGRALVPAGMEYAPQASQSAILLGTTAPTIGDLKAKLGWAEGDYYTICGLRPNGKFAYARFKFVSTLADTTAISAANIDTLFDIETNFEASVTFTEPVGQAGQYQVNLVFTAANQCGGLIVTRKTAQGYKHSSCKFELTVDPTWTADYALPTYPQGEELFLNGGDI